MFNGPEYLPERDSGRLSVQHTRIRNLMLDGEWRTLATIAKETNDPEPSISAQLRHLRKKRFGCHVVNRRHMGCGLYEYQVLVPISMVAVVYVNAAGVARFTL